MGKTTQASNINDDTFLDTFRPLLLVLTGQMGDPAQECQLTTIAIVLPETSIKNCVWINSWTSSKKILFIEAAKDYVSIDMLIAFVRR